MTGGGQRGLPQRVFALKLKLCVILRAHQRIRDVEIRRAKRVGQEGLQGAQVIGQRDFQDLGGAQLVHELTAVAARGVVDGDFADPGLATQPGVGDGGLLGVDRVEQTLPRKLHVGTEVPGAAQAAGDGTDIKLGDGRHRAGGGQRQQGEAQGAIIETCGGFQGGDLLRREAGVEVGTIQHGLHGCFERGREGIEWLGKTGMHSVSSKANWAAIVGSKLG